MNEQLPPPEYKPRQSSWKKFQKLSIKSGSLKKHAARMESATSRHAHKFIFKRIDNIKFVRRQIMVWFVAVAVVLAGIGVQYVFLNRNIAASGSSVGGTYAEGVVGTIDSLNPLQASTSAEVAVSRLMFSSLYSYDEQGKLRGDLARSINVSSSGEVYTVKLREDATWHDGRDVTVDDVLFTVETIQNPESRTRSSLRTNWQDIEVAKLDKYTIKFTLPAYAAFPHALTFPVIPRHLLADMPATSIPESAFAAAPVGSGPFVFRFLQNSDIASSHRTVHMAVNEEYYKRPPKLGRFELHAYPDEEQLTRALRAREVTAAADVGRSTIDELSQSSYEVQSHTLDSGVYLLMNNADPLLRNKDIRKALQLAVDTAAIRDRVGGGVEELGLPFLPSHLDDDALPKAPVPNLRRAAQLLERADWKLVDDVRTKDKNPMTLQLTTIKGDQYQLAVEEIARQIRQLGIRVEVTVIDDRVPGSNFRQDILQQRNYQMLVYELPIGADPDVYAYWHSSQLGVSGYNFTNYSNGVVDAALVSARDQTDTELRNEKYVAMARQWIDDAPAIGLYQRASYYVYSRNASGLSPGASLVASSDRYFNVQNWTVSPQQVYKTP